MVFEVIGGAVLIAFGILSILFSIENDFSDTKLIGVFIIGIIAIIAGFWLLALSLTWILIIRKIVALILLGFGFFMVKDFPDITDYQKGGMSLLGVFIGVILLIIGIYFILF